MQSGHVFSRFLFNNYTLLCLASAGMAVSGCGGGQGASVPVPSSSITSVTVSPQGMSVLTGHVQQFSASVQGTGTFSSAVMWSVNSSIGGNNVLGVIDATGLYTAPKGKPPYPIDDATTEARIRWFNTPPRARHLVYWDGVSQRTLTFEKSTGVFSFHVQRFGKGWLLGEGRGGRADICDREGRPQRTLDLGDASNDVQTTSNGPDHLDLIRPVAAGPLCTRMCPDHSAHHTRRT